MLLLYKIYIFLIFVFILVLYELKENNKNKHLNDKVNKDLKQILESNEYNDNNSDDK